VDRVAAREPRRDGDLPHAGIATAACAWYTSFAITANRTTRRDWIPMGEMRSAQQDAP
jgi:hypothetical protein